MYKFILLLLINTSVYSQWLYPIVKNKKLGFINEKGVVIVEPQYETYGYKINSTKNMFEIPVSTDTPIPVCIKKNNRNKMGCINEKNVFIIPPNFNYISQFSNGFARYWDQGKFGYIDENGNLLTKPIYEWAGDMEDGVAKVAIQTASGIVKVGYINSKGIYVITPQEIPFFDIVSVSSRYYQDYRKNFLKYKTLNDFGTFKNGLICISRRRYINIEQTTVIDLTPYQQGYDFSEELACVRSEDDILNVYKYGYIDEKGAMRIKPQFDKALSFKEGFAVVGFENRLPKKVTYRYPKISKDGTAVYAYETFVEKRLAINFGGSKEKYGYINRHGNVVIDYKYDEAYSFSSGLAVIGVKKADKIKYGYINKQGKIVISPVFNIAKPFIGDLAYAITEKQEGYINQKGDFIWRMD